MQQCPHDYNFHALSHLEDKFSDICILERMSPSTQLNCSIDRADRWIPGMRKGEQQQYRGRARRGKDGQRQCRDHGKEV